MSKATVTRLFIGGTLAVIAGAILAVIAIALAFANNVFVMNGPDVVGVRGGTLAWSLLGLGILGGLAIMGGLISALVSWIGALLNTWRIDSSVASCFARLLRKRPVSARSLHSAVDAALVSLCLEAFGYKR